MTFGISADQFAAFIDHGLAIIVIGLGCHAEHSALDFAAAHRQ